MASSSENSSDSNSPATVSLSVFGFSNMVDPDYDSNYYNEMHEKMSTDPAFIKLREHLCRPRCNKTPPEIIHALVDLSQSFHDLRVKKYPRLSSRLSNPEAAYEQFGGYMTRMKQDPELRPILAEFDANPPAAFLKFWDDEDVLKKLSRAMVIDTATHEGLDKHEVVSEGRKALRIAIGFVQMKLAKLLSEAQAKAKAGSGKKKGSLHHHGAKGGRKKRVEKVAAGEFAHENMESKTPIDVDTTSSMC